MHTGNSHRKEVKNPKKWLDLRSLYIILAKSHKLRSNWTNELEAVLIEAVNWER